MALCGKVRDSYQAAVAIVGVGLIVLECWGVLPPDPILFLLLLGCAFVSESMVIRFPGGIETTATFVLVLPAFYILGVPWAAAIYGMSVLASGMLIHRKPLLVTAFNSVQSALGIFFGGYLYHLSDGTLLEPAVIPSILFIVGFAIGTWLIRSGYHLLYHSVRHGNRDRIGSLKWDLLFYIPKVPLGVLILVMYKGLGLVYAGAASAAVLIITNLLRLYGLLATANNELRIIHEVSKEVMASLDLDKVFGFIADAVDRLVRADNSIILFWEKEKEHFRIVSVRHPHPGLVEGVTFGLDEGCIGSLAGSVARERCPRIFEYQPKEPENGLMKAGVTSSIMVFPLTIEDRLIGEIMVSKEKPGGFKQENLRVLSILAAQAAVAIENASLYRQARLLAITDGLTGLYNYRYFYARLAEEISRSGRTHAPFSLVYLDVDNFKRHNDAHGHLVGDDILRELARIVSAGVRSSDIAVRYAGDEFVLLLPGTPREEALRIADRMKADVEAHNFVERLPCGSLRLEVSVGVASYPEEPLDEELLVQAADRAMYAMKKKSETLQEIP